MSIKSKKDLKDFLSFEKKLYFENNSKYLQRILLQDHEYVLWKYQKTLRIFEYHLNTGHKLRYLFWNRKSNILSSKLGIRIQPNTIDKGLRIWHFGSVIVNGYARIGKNCVLHGCNCVGNKGGNDMKAPKIGNNVDIGVGAVVIGDVYIADDVVIGANAVVTKSCYEKGAVLVGNPARILKK